MVIMTFKSVNSTICCKVTIFFVLKIVKGDFNMLDIISQKPIYTEPIEKIFPIELEAYPSIKLSSDPITHLHFHSIYELGICYSGKGKCIFLDFDADFEVGDITLVSPYQPHYSRSNIDAESEWHFFYFDLDTVFSLNGFTPEYWRSLFNQIDRPFMFFSRKQHSNLCNLAKKIVETANSVSPHRKTEVTLLIAQFVIAASKEPQNYNFKYRLNSSDVVSRLLPAVQFIRHHYQDTFSVPELAKLCNMSETSFRRNFNQAFNMSPTEYILSIRMRIAAHYLRNSKMSISDIANTCGIPDSTNFIRYFSKTFNTTPKKYRDQPKNNMSD